MVASDIATIHITKDPNSWTDTVTTEEKIKRYTSVLANTAELAIMSDAAAIGMRGSGFARISIWLGDYLLMLCFVVLQPTVVPLLHLFFLVPDWPWLMSGLQNGTL